MVKKFNVTGLCVPEKHYMADLTKRVREIRKMVDAGDYFTINRGRQYGKTTTLAALARELDRDYLVISLDFQDIGSASFESENMFSLAFLRIFLWELEERCLEETSQMAALTDRMRKIVEKDDEKFNLLVLFEHLRDFCRYSTKPVLLLIDEVDSASNNQVFLDFLAQLRSNYLKREAKGTPAFRSVILAGVYDIKNLKGKIRPEEEHKVNSPWNIAADFDIDMSFSEDEIAGMLKEYEEDHRVGMNIWEMAGLLYDYTSGYPYLVSRLCKMMDEEINRSEVVDSKGKAWTKSGFYEAVRMILNEKNTLFDSLIGKLTNYPELNSMLQTLLFTGKSIAYNSDEQALDIAAMFGFIKNAGGSAVIANRIFETRLYNYYLGAVFSPLSAADHQRYRELLRGITHKES